MGFGLLPESVRLRGGRRAAAFVVALAVWMSALVVGTASASTASGVSVQVNSWSRDPATGRLSYNLTLAGTDLSHQGTPKGPCAGGRRWRLWQVYRDSVGAQVTRSEMTSGGIAQGTTTLNQQVTATDIASSDITHIQAEVYTTASATSGFERPLSPEVEVATPTPRSSVSLQVNSWTRDPATGRLSYDLTIGGSNLARQDPYTKGPCASRCRWRLWAVYRDTAGAEVTRSELGDAEILGGRNTVNQQVTATNVSRGDVTHVQAEVYTTATSTSGYERPRSPEVAVATPTPPSTAYVQVNSWTRDPATGRLSYDLTVGGNNLARQDPYSRGPCSASCSWRLWVYYRDAAGALVSSKVLADGWIDGQPNTLTQTVSAADIPYDAVTHLQAQVYTRATGGGYARAISHERRVTDLMVANLDLVPSRALLAPLAGRVARDQICLPYLGVPIRDSLSSVPAAYRACEAIVLAGTGAITAYEIHQILAAAGKAGADVARSQAPADPAAPPDPGTGAALLETDAFILGHATTINPDGAVVLPEVGTSYIVSRMESFKKADDLDTARAARVANACRDLVLRPGANVGLAPNGDHPCAGMPVFAPGSDVYEAADHDLDAILDNPQGVQLTHALRTERETEVRSAGFTARPGWYTGHPDCQHSRPGDIQCDEYPYMASEQGGPRGNPADSPEDWTGASLRPIRADHNVDEGGLLGGFKSRCGIVIRWEPFLVVPLPIPDGPPTTYACNRN